eukprot:Amastigsp_a346678_25.p4 type:complete len:155 gc:universal Amastigsp_a346678_25:827-363(-)
MAQLRPSALRSCASIARLRTATTLCRSSPPGPLLSAQKDSRYYSTLLALLLLFAAMTPPAASRALWLWRTKSSAGDARCARSSSATRRTVSTGPPYTNPSAVAILDVILFLLGAMTGSTSCRSRLSSRVSPRRLRPRCLRPCASLPRSHAACAR